MFRESCGSGCVLEESDGAGWTGRLTSGTAVLITARVNPLLTSTLSITVAGDSITWMGTVRETLRSVGVPDPWRVGGEVEEGEEDGTVCT